MWTDALLFAAAFCAGAVNSIAGGGTLLTFPALLYAGVPAVTANATSTMALVPGSLSAFFANRGELRGEARLLLAMAAPSLMGGMLGARAADRMGDESFARLAPLLVLGATVLFMAHDPIRRRSGASSDFRSAEQRGGGRLAALAALAALQFLVSIYGGFFGAGIGILMLAALGMLGISDIYRRNAFKNLAAVCINGSAALTFALADRIEWPTAGLMMLGGVAGGYSGARLALRVGPAFVRRSVVAIGLAISVALTARLLL